ncbi:MAG: sulfotransferase family protein, partial [Acidimicrobiales bacterium]
LQWQKKQRGETALRWLLKSPYHLHWMAILLQVFPDSQVIATHRDPAVTIPSVTSLFYNLWLIGDPDADKLVVAGETAEVFARGVSHTLETREGNEERFFDVWYHDTVSKPLEVMEDVYGFMGLELTPAVRDAMVKHLGANKREDRPPHEYTLEEYGYTETGIHTMFKTYCQRFIDDRQGPGA